MDHQRIRSTSKSISKPQTKYKIYYISPLVKKEICRFRDYNPTATSEHIAKYFSHKLAETIPSWYVAEILKAADKTVKQLREKNSCITWVDAQEGVQRAITYLEAHDTKADIQIQMLRDIEQFIYDLNKPEDRPGIDLNLNDVEATINENTISPEEFAKENDIFSSMDCTEEQGEEGALLGLNEIKSEEFGDGLEVEEEESVNIEEHTELAEESGEEWTLEEVTDLKFVSAGEAEDRDGNICRAEIVKDEDSETGALHIDKEQDSVTEKLSYIVKKNQIESQLRNMLQEQLKTRRTSKSSNVDSPSGKKRGRPVTNIPGPHQCHMCNRTLKHLRALKEHMQGHIDNYPFKCKDCGQLFRQRVNMERHCRKAHRSGDLPHKCHLCSESFLHPYALKVHLASHDGLCRYMCEVCSQGFHWMSHLQRHMKIHYDVYTYHCDLCDAKFKHEWNLQDHVKLHTGEKNYECLVCEKKFTHASACRVHQLTHTQIKPYVCKLCDKRFPTSRRLDHHVATHRDQTNFQCPHCAQRFSRRNTLTNHVKSHEKRLQLLHEKKKSDTNIRQGIDNHVDNERKVIQIRPETETVTEVKDESESPQLEAQIHGLMEASNGELNCSMKDEEDGGGENVGVQSMEMNLNTAVSSEPASCGDVMFVTAPSDSNITDLITSPAPESSAQILSNVLQTSQEIATLEPEIDMKEVIFSTPTGTEPESEEVVEYVQYVVRDDGTMEIQHEVSDTQPAQNMITTEQLQYVIGSADTENIQYINVDNVGEAVQYITEVNHESTVLNEQGVQYVQLEHSGTEVVTTDTQGLQCIQVQVMDPS